MKVLHVTEQGAILTKKGNRLVLYKQREKIATVRIRQLEQVVLWGAIRLSPGAIRLFLENGIDVVFLSSRGRYYGRLVGMASKNAPLRQAQWERRHDPVFRIAIARRLLSAKLYNCRTFLRHLNRRRQRREIQEALQQIRRIMNQLEQASDTATLMGYEGEAASAYFRAVGACLDHPYFRFTKRTRRPPRDATNALLSFTYMMILSLVQRWAEIVGFDPYIGYLHDVGYNKPSLCLDLMEPFRPVLGDAFVIDCIQRGRIKPDDFDESGVGDDRRFRLTSDGLKKFVAMWEFRRENAVIDPATGHSVTWTGIVERQVRAMARAVREGQPDHFEPYRWM